MIFIMIDDCNCVDDEECLCGDGFREIKCLPPIVHVSKFYGVVFRMTLWRLTAFVESCLFILIADLCLLLWFLFVIV